MSWCVDVERTKTHVFNNLQIELEKKELTKQNKTKVETLKRISKTILFFLNSNAKFWWISKERNDKYRGLNHNEIEEKQWIRRDL